MMSYTVHRCKMWQSLCFCLVLFLTSVPSVAQESGQEGVARVLAVIPENFHINNLAYSQTIDPDSSDAAALFVHRLRDRFARKNLYDATAVAELLGEFNYTFVIADLITDIDLRISESFQQQRSEGGRIPAVQQFISAAGDYYQVNAEKVKIGSIDTDDASAFIEAKLQTGALEQHSQHDTSPPIYLFKPKQGQGSQLFLMQLDDWRIAFSQDERMLSQMHAAALGELPSLLGSTMHQHILQEIDASTVWWDYANPYGNYLIILDAMAADPRVSAEAIEEAREGYGELGGSYSFSQVVVTDVVEDVTIYFALSEEDAQRRAEQVGSNPYRRAMPARAAKSAQASESRTPPTVVNVYDKLIENTTVDQDGQRVVSRTIFNQEVIKAMLQNVRALKKLQEEEQQ